MNFVSVCVLFPVCRELVEVISRQSNVIFVLQDMSLHVNIHHFCLQSFLHVLPMEPKDAFFLYSLLELSDSKLANKLRKTFQSCQLNINPVNCV